MTTCVARPIDLKKRQQAPFSLNASGLQIAFAVLGLG